MGDERYFGAGGKTVYIAPEMWKDDYEARLVDAWAVGVAIYIMVTGVPPWNMAKKVDANFKYFLRNGLDRYITAMKMEDLFSRELLDLLNNLLRVNPEDRMTVEAALEHPWFQ